MILLLLLGVIGSGMVFSTCQAVQLSEATQTCLACHVSVMPGIHGDWLSSRHYRVAPANAMALPQAQKRISLSSIEGSLGQTAVGCAECHMLRPEEHPDSFEHNGFRIHTVVSPADCATCHPVEVEQYKQNIMSHAYGNLMGNALFSLLAASINGVHTIAPKGLDQGSQDPLTLSDSCLSCHGTKVQVTEIKKRPTSMGEMEFPVLSGWPNQGVGRINPDASMGSCTACHTRHAFSIEVARKPQTCSQCHQGPDVPAFPVYKVSKHGNLYEAQANKWNFQEVPWRLGKDFTAPTCAACHASLLAGPDGEVLVERTHRMNDRLPWRLFGLVYSHPHPQSPDTSKIRNKAGLPLPTELTGEPVDLFLIQPQELDTRLQNMKQVCWNCHSTSWVEAHFQKLENTLSSTNQSTLAATRILLRAWEQGLASRENPFEEPIEKHWVQQWLFFANSTRFASAMGAADYGVFANGRWNLSKNLSEMWEWLRQAEASRKEKK